MENHTNYQHRPVLKSESLSNILVLLLINPSSLQEEVQWCILVDKHMAYMYSRWWLGWRGESMPKLYVDGMKRTGC